MGSITSIQKKMRLVHPAPIAFAILVATGCASRGAVPRPFPVPRTAEAPAPPAAETPVGRTSLGDAPSVVLRTALALIGTPYRNGGSSPKGFDCSGFTQWVFARHGIVIPRETREQFATGLRVDRAAVAPGDLLFFSTVAPGASHVGIAVDEDRFVHAPSSRGVVRVERRSSAYWQRRFIGARRVEAN